MFFNPRRTSVSETPRRPRRMRLVLEMLEDRLAPATVVWTGDQDNLWGTNNAGNTNWAGDVLPVDGDDLLFPAVAANFTNSNNIVGLDLLQIEFGGTLSVVSGNPVTLTGPVGLLDSSAAGSNTLNLNVALAVSTTFGVNQVGSTLTVGGVVSGTADVTKSGPGRLVLNTAASYVGTTTISNGTLAIGVNDAVPVSSPLVVSNPGVFDLNGFNQTVPSLAGTGTVTNGGALVRTLTLNITGTPQFDGVLSGNLSLVKTGAGTQTLAGANPNTYAGTTSITEGVLNLNKPIGVIAVPGAGPSLTIGDGLGAGVDTVRLSEKDQLSPTLAPVILSTGLLDVGIVSQEVAGLDLTAGTVSSTSGVLMVSGDIMSRAAAASSVISGNLDLTGGTRNFVVANGAAATDLDVSARISNGALTKVGPGLLRLGGANVYAGATVISDGTLQVDGSILSPTTLNGGTLAGIGSIGTLTSGAGGSVAPGAAGGGGPGTLASGNLALNAATTFRVQLDGTIPGDAPGNHDQLNVSGSVNLGGAALNPTLGFAPVPGDRFVLITNDGADAVAGTFAGLAERSTLNIGGNVYEITYRGGDGNDVVLTRLHLNSFSFAISNVDQQVYIQRFDLGTLMSASSWTLVAPGQFASIASGSYGTARAPVVFGIGLNGQVYEARFDANGNLIFGWVLVAPGSFQSLVVGRYGPQESPIVFGVGAAGTGNQVFAARFNDQAVLLNGWFSVAPGSFANLAVGSFGLGSPEVFGVGLDHSVYGARFDGNGNFAAGWFTVAPGSFDSLTVGSRNNGTLELFGISNGQVVAANFDSNGAFVNGWFGANTGQTVPFTQIDAAVLGNNHVTLFALGTDQRVYRTTFHGATGAQSSSWASVSTTLFAQLAANSHVFMRLYALGVADSQVYVEISDSGGGPLAPFGLTAPGTFFDLDIA